MGNDEKNIRDVYSEYVSKSAEGNKIYIRNKSVPVIWYEEKKAFQSMFEAQEYISSEIYPAILQSCNGYKTTDPKLAYSLLFELIKTKTHGSIELKVFADIEVINNQLYYLVWISSS